MEMAKKEQIAQIALSALGQDDDYLLVDDLGLHAHGLMADRPQGLDSNTIALASSAPPNDDNAHAMAAAVTKIEAALKRAGYRIPESNMFSARFANYGKRGETPGYFKVAKYSVNVSTRENPSDEVEIKLHLGVPLEFSAVDPRNNGMRVAAKDDLVRLKAQALTYGEKPKINPMASAQEQAEALATALPKKGVGDYLDWRKINKELGTGAIDAYLATSSHPIRMDGFTYLAKKLNQASDDVFAMYGLKSDQLHNLRTSFQSVTNSKYPLTNDVFVRSEERLTYERYKRDNPKSPKVAEMRERVEGNESRLMKSVAVYAAKNGAVADTAARRRVTAAPEGQAEAVSLRIPAVSKERCEAWVSVAAKVREVVRTPYQLLANTTDVSVAAAAGLHNTTLNSQSSERGTFPQPTATTARSVVPPVIASTVSRSLAK